MNRYELRLSGSGGQGLILAGIILGEAVSIYDNKNAVQTQSYGPEARGGASRSEVIISNEEIDYPKIRKADLLLAMSQEAYDTYINDLKENGILVFDPLFVKINNKNSNKYIIYEIEATKIALEKIGKKIFANIVALGFIVGITNIVSIEAIKKSLIARAPKGTEESNLIALEEGYKEAFRKKNIMGVKNEIV